MNKKLDLGSGYFNFNVPEDVKENPHYFCSEELFSPFIQSCDTQRLNLFSNHITQTVHLKNPEFPKVFTGFENQIGEYSIAYKKAEQDFVIIAKIPKNKLCYTLVVKYKDGIYDCIDVNRGVNISEDYGYALNDCLGNKGIGETVKKGEFIYRSDNYDEDGNFAYGVNLKAVYLPFLGKTYEDGFVITESAAKKLTSYKVEKTTVSINTNDILLNLYAEDDEYLYHSIPKVGEHTKGSILVASRREESQNILYNFQLNRMKEIDPNDQIFYTCGGIITDINIYSNISLEKLRARNNEFAREVADLYEEQLNYYKALVEVLDAIIPPLTEEEYVSRLSASEKKVYDAEKKEYGHYYVRPTPRCENPNMYSDELGYKWKYAHEYLDGKISWRSDGKRFDNFKIEFTILKENPLMIGAKCTGRYGNKGVCSEIIPDDMAPYDPITGIRAEIILNPLAIVNRLNPAQLNEQFINFIADHVLREMQEHYNNGNFIEALDTYLEFLKCTNKQQYDYIDAEMIMSSRTKKMEFVENILEEGIYIHEPPFVGNTEFTDFVKIFKSHPEWLTEYKCVGIEKPLVIGDEYFIRLKHESSNKMSIRATGMLNIKNQPSKSALKKEKKSFLNDNAIRLGEMESENLLVTKRPDLVSRLFRTYSTESESREELITKLLTEKDPFNLEIKGSDAKSITRQMLDKYLMVLELSLED